MPFTVRTLTRAWLLVRSSRAEEVIAVLNRLPR